MAAALSSSIESAGSRLRRCRTLTASPAGAPPLSISARPAWVMRICSCWASVVRSSTTNSGLPDACATRPASRGPGGPPASCPESKSTDSVSSGPSSSRAPQSWWTASSRARTACLSVGLVVATTSAGYCRHRPGEPAQHRQARAVGPVEVVDNHQQLGRGAQRFEHANHRLDQAVDLHRGRPRGDRTTPGVRRSAWPVRPGPGRRTAGLSAAHHKSRQTAWSGRTGRPRMPARPCPGLRPRRRSRLPAGSSRCPHRPAELMCRRGRPRPPTASGGPGRAPGPCPPGSEPPSQGRPFPPLVATS